MTCWATSRLAAGRATSSRTARPKRAVVVATQRDVGDDLGAGGVDLHRAGDELQGGVEAGGVARGEQLLGVGGPTLTAHLLGGAHGRVDVAVEGLDVAVAAVPGGDGRGGVESVHVHNHIVHNRIVQMETDTVVE